MAVDPMFSLPNSTYLFLKNKKKEKYLQIIILKPQITTHVLHLNKKIKLIINNGLLPLKNDLSLIPG